MSRKDCQPRRAMNVKGGNVAFKEDFENEKENVLATLKNLTLQLKPDSFVKLQEQMLGIIDQFQGQDCCEDDSKHVKENGKSSNVQRKKIFKPRESLLISMFEVDHIKTIYNFFVALLILFSINTFLHDYLESGRIQLNFSIITWAFGKPLLVVMCWGKMFLYTLLAYPLCLLCLQMKSMFMLPVYFIYMGIFSYFPLADVKHYRFPPASTMIIITEQVRLCMKVHSFMRENADKWRFSKSVCEEVKPLNPRFRQFCYFLFAPTLVYRDHYPMTKQIRWSFIFVNSAQFGMSVLYLYYVMARFCVPVFHNTGKEPGNIRSMLMVVFSCMLPGTMVLILAFFAILHCWLNAFAELLRFGDRMFYRDWWNSTSYAAWYRNWNVVVHDWLFAYIYQEAILQLGKRGRFVGVLSVFFLSAVVHEYILIVAFGFIFPVLFIMFGGIGLALVFLKPGGDAKKLSSAWNTFMWASLITGNGLLMLLYSQEWYANINCPRTAVSFMDLLIPRSWNSDCVDWSWDIPLGK